MLTPEQVREIAEVAASATGGHQPRCDGRRYLPDCPKCKASMFLQVRGPLMLESLLRDRAEIAAELEDLKPMHDWYAAAPEGGLKCDPCCMACRLNALIERIKA